MVKRLLIVVTIVLLQIYLLCQCNTVPDKSPISRDPAVIASGEALFNQACSGCHNFRQDGIGPHLRGLTASVSTEWIHSFITNPQRILLSGDERG